LLQNKLPSSLTLDRIRSIAASTNFGIVVPSFSTKVVNGIPKIFGFCLTDGFDGAVATVTSEEESEREDDSFLTGTGRGFSLIRSNREEEEEREGVKQNNFNHFFIHFFF
jgi:hypothetical protein